MAANRICSARLPLAFDPWPLTLPPAGHFETESPPPLVPPSRDNGLHVDSSSRRDCRTSDLDLSPSHHPAETARRSSTRQLTALVPRVRSPSHSPRKRARLSQDFDETPLTNDIPNLSPLDELAPDELSSEMASPAATHPPSRQTLSLTASADLDDLFTFAQQSVISPRSPTVLFAYKSESTDLKGNIKCRPLGCTYPTSPSDDVLQSSKELNTQPQSFGFRFNEQVGHFYIDYDSSANEPQRSHEQPPLPHVDFKGTLVNEGNGSGPVDADVIPLEIFDIILQHVAREDMKNLRLVNHAFERKVSAFLFHTVVVPFNAHLYGRKLARSLTRSSDGDSDRKGKQKDKKPKDMVDCTDVDENFDVDIFSEFGNHIQKFCVSFEANQEDLANTGVKHTLQPQKAYWGTFKWPLPEYPRFDDRVGLENLADETRTMTLAFSHLKAVNHLALAIDAGLGWPSGLDSSIRQQVLGRPFSVFGNRKHGALDASVHNRRKMWDLLKLAYEESGSLNTLLQSELAFCPVPGGMKFTDVQSDQWLNLKLDVPMISRDCPTTSEFVARLVRSRSSDIKIISKLSNFKFFEPYMEQLVSLCSSTTDHDRTANETRANILRDRTHSSYLARLQQFRNVPFSHHLATSQTNPNSSFAIPPLRQTSCSGFLFTRQLDEDHESHGANVRRHSYGLRRSQKEWLMENTWAQDAFLASYTLAVTDNALAFENVRTLTLSSISSRFLPKFYRDDFWESLRSLDTLYIRVIADRRDVRFNTAGTADLPKIKPSDAGKTFFCLLHNVIALRKNLSNINVGWAEGGEHAQGLCARNRHLLPSPIVSPSTSFNTLCSAIELVDFPYATSVSIANCWMTPQAVEKFVKQHCNNGRLQSLTLDSVSLTGTIRLDVVTVPVGVQQMIRHAQTFNDPNLPSPPPPLPNVWGQIAAAIASGQTQSIPAILLNLSGRPSAQIQMISHIMTSGGVDFEQAVNLALSHLHLMTRGHNTIAASVMDNILNLLPDGPTMQFLVGQGNAQLQPSQAQSPATPVTTDDKTARPGSWADVISRMRHAALHANRADLSITFWSCGYATIGARSYPQFPFEDADGALDFPNPAVKMLGSRRKALDTLLTPASDVKHGQIVTSLPVEELELLKETWGMYAGWPRRDILGDDYDDQQGWGRWGHRNVEASAYDGYPNGGSGRFSGRIVGFLPDEVEPEM